MTHDQTGRDAIYAMGYTEDELRRLTDQGQLYASSTRALLLDAGIGPGMHVLDVGCGPGDVSLLVAERVGPSGEVIGVDTNERVLQLARARLSARVVANSLRSALPLVEQFGIATAAEVDIDTFAQRYLAELNASGAVHMLPPTMSAWTRTPNP